MPTPLGLRKSPPGKETSSRLPGGGHQVEVVPATPSKPPDDAGWRDPGEEENVRPGRVVPQDVAIQQKLEKTKRIVLLLGILAGGAVFLGLVGLLIAWLRRGATRPPRPARGTYPSWMDEVPSASAELPGPGNETSSGEPSGPR
jgi:hypothetical protein